MEAIKVTMAAGNRVRMNCNIAKVKGAVTAATDALPSGKFWLVIRGTRIKIQETQSEAQWNCDALDEVGIEMAIEGLQTWVKVCAS